MSVDVVPDRDVYVIVLVRGVLAKIAILVFLSTGKRVCAIRAGLDIGSERARRVGSGLVCGCARVVLYPGFGGLGDAVIVALLCFPRCEKDLNWA
jgi:hypothetical protein